MTHKWLFLVFFLFPFVLIAQTPDNDLIRQEIRNPESRFYYPALYSRYVQGDLTLDAEDYHHLYYGYIFSPDYNPLQAPPQIDSIMVVFERNPDPTVHDLEKLVKYGEAILLSEPFNPRILNILAFAYGGLGDLDQEIICFTRLKMIMETIMASGIGTLEKSPWHILYFSHSEDVMDYLNYPYSKRMVVSRTTEYVPLLIRQGKIRGYYFDYSRVYSNYYPTDRKREGVEINGIRIK